jgi:hypothetical protein
MTIYVRQAFSGAGVGIGDWNIPLVAAPVETATTITINVPLHADIKWGSSNNQLSIEDDTGIVLLENVTFSASPDATSIVQTGIPDPAKASYHEYAKTDAEIGNFTSAISDTLIFENQSGLSVDGETVPTIDPAADKSGWYKFWDESLGAHTPVSSYSWVDDGLPSVDTEIPVITLIGNASASIVVGGTYTDAGANVTDNIDAASTISGVSTVDPNSVGSYTVTFNYTDAAGNVAVQVVRAVEVIATADTENPVITLIGSAIVELMVGDTYTDLGANVSDNVDADSILVGNSNLNVNVVGNYAVTFDYIDGAGNPAIQVVRTINVVEVIPSFTGTLISWETNLPFANETGLKMIIRATFEGDSLGTMQIFSTDIDGNFSVPYAGAEDATEYFVAITDANETITELHKLTAEA